MARQAEKQLAKNNVTKIAFLRNSSLGVNAFFVLVRLIWCYRSTTKKTWFLYITTNLVASLIHFQLAAMGSPKFSADGSLKSAGEDLSQAGLTEYLTDIVYMTWIIYVLVAAVTDYAWLLYLAVSVHHSVSFRELTWKDSWVRGLQSLATTATSHCTSQRTNRTADPFITERRTRK